MLESVLGRLALLSKAGFEGREQAQGETMESPQPSQ